MTRLKIVLICLAGAVGVFAGGWVLGTLVGDSEPAATAAPVAVSEEDTVEIPVAVPLGYGEDMPDPEVLQEQSEASSVAIPSQFVEPLPVDPDGDAGETPRIGEFRIAGTDVEPEGVDRYSEPLPPFEPLTVPLGEPDDDGEIEPSGFEVLSDDDTEIDVGDLVELEEILGPVPEDPAYDESGDDDGAPTPMMFGFFDLCAEGDDSDGAGGDDDSGGLCPFGVGGTILPVDDRSDLPEFILGTLFDWTVSFTDHCDPLGWDSETDRLHVLITSSAPGDFQMSYSPYPAHSYEPRVLTFSTSEDEVDRWHRLIAEGATHPRVYNCLSIDVPPEWQGEDVLTSGVSGTDLLGRETTRRFAISLHTMREMETRPPIRLEHRGERRLSTEGFFVVPYDPEVEQGWLAVIPVDGPRASTESCTDIEHAVLDSSRPRDPVIANTYTARLQGRSPNDMARVSHAAVARITPEPGTTYRFCGWATRTGPRSFDRPFPVERNQIVATSPRTLSARVSFTGGLLTMPRDARDLQIQAVNWHHDGRPTPETTATAFADAMPVGEFTLDEPQLLFDGTLLQVPNQTVLQISNTQGWSQSVIVPTPVSCELVCPEPGAREYGVSLPGPGMSGWVRVLVETEAGPAGSPTMLIPYWQFPGAGVPTEFGAPEPRERPATPRIDTNGSFLRAFGTGLEPRGVEARLAFDRPVRIVEATPELYYGEECGRTPETVETDDFGLGASMLWDDLCYDRTYVLSLLVEDEDGNQLDLRRSVDGMFVDERGWGSADTAPIEVRSYDWEVQINRLDDYVGVHMSWFIGHPVEVSGGGFADWCMEPDEPRVFSGRVDRPYARNLQWDEYAGFVVRLQGWADGENCGVDDPRPEVSAGGSLSTFDLAEGEPLTIEIDNDRIDATITISNVVLAR